MNAVEARDKARNVVAKEFTVVLSDIKTQIERNAGAGMFSLTYVGMLDGAAQPTETVMQRVCDALTEDGFKARVDPAVPGACRMRIHVEWEQA